jgi:hypothetical protein
MAKKSGASRKPHPNSLANLNHRPKPGRSRKIQITSEDEDLYKSAGDGNLTDGVRAIAKFVRGSAFLKKPASPIDWEEEKAFMLELVADMKEARQGECLPEEVAAFDAMLKQFIE